MAGPLKPNDPNRRGDSNGGDDKKRTPLGFFSIVLWAIMLVFLLNTCRSTVESASVQTVNYSDFYNWVEEGYVAEVKLDAKRLYLCPEGGRPAAQGAGGPDGGRLRQRGAPGAVQPV